MTGGDDPTLSAWERLALGAYVVLMNTVGWVVLALAFPALMLSAKRRRSLPARVGWQAVRLPLSSKGPLWIHALSLGEVLSCVSLVRVLRQRVKDRPIVFSVSTTSGMQIARDRLSHEVDAFLFFPLDFQWSVRRALAMVRPSLVVLVETDIWPGFQAELRRQRCPSILVNGRLSPTTYRTCVRAHWLFKPALNSFAVIHPQSHEQRRRFLEVGVDEQRLVQPGNLKFDVSVSKSSNSDLRRVRDSIDARDSGLVLLAGSTHPGEEEIIRRVYLRLRQTYPDLRLIVVPRHPTRGGQVRQLFARDSLKCCLWSELRAARPLDVLVVDVMGILSSLYELADLAFVGGSLVSKGGQNPIEAATVGVPVIFGPDMEDFPEISKWLLEAEAARQIANEAELEEAIRNLLRDPAERNEMGHRGRKVVDLNTGTTNRIAETISALLATA